MTPQLVGTLLLVHSAPTSSVSAELLEFGQTAKVNNSTELVVNRSSVGETLLREVSAADLAPDHIRMEIERFALTSNNMTYAQFGAQLDYWGFFPTELPWGNVPAMGWGRVTESNVTGVAVGDRFYGWFPMATSVDVLATPVPLGVRDDGAHRANHAAVYRMFTRSDLDGLYTTAEDEDRHSLLRGLFLTGFLVDGFFGAASYNDATQAIVLSASSKTALGYAHSAKGRDLQLIGLTSASNKAFVEGVGLYDIVLSYDETEQIPLEPSVVIDMAGSGSVVSAVHERLGDRITYSMGVGKSHHDAPSAKVTAGPKPQTFFAPTAAGDRVQEWGIDEYQRRIKDALSSFIDDSRRWLEIDERRGPEAASAAWASLFAGTVAPSTGLIVSMHD